MKTLKFRDLIILVGVELEEVFATLLRLVSMKL
jgi:hypothetical protein